MVHAYHLFEGHWIVVFGHYLPFVSGLLPDRNKVCHWIEVASSHRIEVDGK